MPTKHTFVGAGVSRDSIYLSLIKHIPLKHSEPKRKDLLEFNRGVRRP